MESASEGSEALFAGMEVESEADGAGGGGERVKGDAGGWGNGEGCVWEVQRAGPRCGDDGGGGSGDDLGKGELKSAEQCWKLLFDRIGTFSLC